MKHEPFDAWLASAPIEDAPQELPLDLLDAPTPPPFFEHGNHTPIDDIGDADAVAEVVNLIALPTFQQQWGLMHDMMGGMIGMRTGAPCPLGDAARSEQGQIASEAAYELIASRPALARMILSPESTFFGQIAAVGMHGFNCLQIVKASARGDTLPPPENGDQSE